MPSTAPDHQRPGGDAVHVAVGVIINSENEVLIAKRPAHVHQGGLWEFPGGKVEHGEDVFTALKRELKEEVNLDIHSANSLIQIPWKYSEKTVLLDVMQVSTFSGEARGLEEQQVKWLSLSEINHYDFPVANRGILNALRLPHSYMITGQFKDMDDFHHLLELSLKAGVKLVQLRAKHLSENDFSDYVSTASQLCEQYHAKLLINSNIEIAKQFNTGVHLNSLQLMSLKTRPLTRNSWVAASVHSELELKQANRLGVDFVVISPVKPTSSHPDATPLGWEQFYSLVQQSTVPVYALGGMEVADRETALQNGAQGIAAIRAFWQ